MFKSTSFNAGAFFLSLPPAPSFGGGVGKQYNLAFTLLISTVVFLLVESRKLRNINYRCKTPLLTPGWGGGLVPPLGVRGLPSPSLPHHSSTSLLQSKLGQPKEVQWFQSGWYCSFYVQKPVGR